VVEVHQHLGDGPVEFEPRPGAGLEPAVVEGVDERRDDQEGVHRKSGEKEREGDGQEHDTQPRTAVRAGRGGTPAHSAVDRHPARGLGLGVDRRGAVGGGGVGAENTPSST